jgi:hypothetical protein
MRLFLKKVSDLYRRASRREVCCEICGVVVADDRSRFCSVECLKKSSRIVACYQCGADCTVKGVAARKLCPECTEKSERRSKRLRKINTGSYRKRCRKGGGLFNPKVRRMAVFERDGWTCHSCSKKCNRILNHPREATLDHYPVPLAKGGDHDWHNVRCACRRCNWERSDAWDGQRTLRLQWSN